MLVLFKVNIFFLFKKKKILVIGLSWCLSLIALIDAEIVLISFGLINKFEKDDTSSKQQFNNLYKLFLELLLISFMIGISILFVLYLYAIKQKPKLM